MARIGQGKGVRATPVLTRGLTDRVWVKNGESRRIDGCYFQVVGTIEKTKGVRNLVDWSRVEFHLRNTRINAMTSFQSVGGPEELVISLNGDSGVGFSPGDTGYSAVVDQYTGITADAYRGGRILLVRGNRLEHPKLPHISLGSAWQGRFMLAGYRDETGDQIVDGRRSDPEDQYGGDYFASWAGWLFITNGVDANIKWNGSYAARVGVNETPSPPRAVKFVSTKYHHDYSIGEEWSGCGDADRGNQTNQIERFQYRCTYVNSAGAEGPPSEPGSFVVTGRLYEDAVQKTWGDGTEAFPNLGDWVIKGTAGGLMGAPAVQQFESAVEDFADSIPDPPPGAPDLGDIVSEAFEAIGQSFLSAGGHDGPVGTLITANPHRAIIKIEGFDRPKQQDLVWRNIYKRARDGEYYFWRQVAVNERNCFDYEIPLSSASMGTSLREGIVAPPTSKFTAFFRGRGYYVSPQYPSFVFYSDPGLPEQLSSALQYLDVNSVDGGPITGLFTFADSLIVFKEDSVWQITALADGSPVLTPVDESIGSVAPRASVLAYERLVFIGKQGVYQFDGASVKPLSEALNEWWKNVYFAGLRTATAWLDERERRLFISMQSGPDDLNDLVVCYHYQLDALTLTKGQRITASTIYKDEELLAVRHPEKAVRSTIRDNPRGQQDVGFGGTGGLVLDSSVPVGIKIRNSDIVIWGLGDSHTYNYAAGLKEPEEVTVGTIAGKIRFGPYSSVETGWNSGEQMEVAGIDIFFPYAGEQNLTVRWYKDRNPVAEGTQEVSLEMAGKMSRGSANEDLVEMVGYQSATDPDDHKHWDQDTWSGRQQVLQRVTFENTVVCREIEIEFQNNNENEPYRLDGFVLWRVSKGAERQR